ncbi:unnamed protein product [Mycena citricolor]|uniref:BTB domain-containing protein n=1 Tax=Mycena citricolor TaxID=2018698 RepID=A0AAD2GSJ1_9AGAR|nr:unnamed protein product [Mycena citricolor]
MSDLARTASPLSSSPGRSDANSFDKPAWPWQSRYSRRQSSSLSAVSSSSNLQTPWEGRPGSSQSGTSYSGGGSWQSQSTMRQSQQRDIGSAVGFGTVQDESTRQWTFLGFEWVVRDVHKLREFLEGVEPEVVEDDASSSVGPDSFDILKNAPLIGESEFKLEISHIQPAEHENKHSSLSLYITSLRDFAHNYEMNASIMVAIKSQDDRVGARVEWVWDFWQHEWIFRRESEVWDCILPPLSALLENDRIQRTDAFTICVQIHSPIGSFFPSQPTAYYVPRDLLDGIESSLDNANTGDVRFVCLERMALDSDIPSTPISENRTPPSNPRPSSSQSLFSPQTTARKRIIYAHSDILSRRSEYFGTMLASSFAETKGITGDRKLYTIVVEEADFETMYWLLKYCYANWLSFKEHDDPRLAVEGIGAGWSAKWLSSRGGDWDWKTFRKVSGDGESTVGDARSATSADDVIQEPISPSHGKGKAALVPEPASTSRSSTQAPKSAPKVISNSASSSRQNPSSSSRRITQPPGPNMGLTSSGGITRSKPIAVATGSPGGFPAAGHYPISPRNVRSHQSLSVTTGDPHAHPTAAPPSASALSVYQLAHRYEMPALGALALDHMMSTITPSSSFGLLLATSVWDELHSLVQDYVVDKWEEVSLSEEFEQCCREISAGEWGPEGGKTLMALFRRLRSPSALAYART